MTAQIDPKQIAAGGAAIGQSLAFNGTQWAPFTEPLGPFYIEPLGGGLDDAPQLTAAMAAGGDVHLLPRATFNIQTPMDLPLFCKPLHTGASPWTTAHPSIARS